MASVSSPFRKALYNYRLCFLYTRTATIIGHGGRAGLCLASLLSPVSEMGFPRAHPTPLPIHGITGAVGETIPHLTRALHTDSQKGPQSVSALVSAHLSDSPYTALFCGCTFRVRPHCSCPLRGTTIAQYTLNSTAMDSVQCNQ